MKSFLPWLDFPGIEIIASIVSETPTKRNVSVRILYSVKLLTANPTLFVGILSVDSVHEQLRCITDVIRDNAVPFSRQYRGMGDGTATGKQVDQCVPRREIGDNPLCNFVLASLIRNAISHSGFLLSGKTKSLKPLKLYTRAISSQIQNKRNLAFHRISISPGGSRDKVPLHPELSRLDAPLFAPPPHRVRAWHSRKGPSLQPSVLETDALPIELREFIECRLQGLNLQPNGYEPSALPIELKRHKNGGLLQLLEKPP